MSSKAVIESTLDVYVSKKPNVTVCGFWPRKDGKKRLFAPAKVRLLETGACGRVDENSVHSSKFLLQISFLAQSKKSVFVPLTDTSTLTRVAKPKHCLLISTEVKKLTVRLAAQSETECQCWMKALLEVHSSAYSARSSQRLSLCLSDYLFSTVDTRQAKTCGLHGFEYWAILEKGIGLTLFPAARFGVASKKPAEETTAISFSFEETIRVELVAADNAADDGKLLEIRLSHTSTKDDQRGSSLKRADKKAKLAPMSRRWRNKSPKKLAEDGQPTSPLTPTASLGYHTLSLFCPDAKKFVEEWKSCQKVSGHRIDKPCPGDLSRLSSTSNTSQSTSSSSPSNLSTLSSLLRRSLPSLNNGFTGSTSGIPPTASTQRPPPLPSRRELEQRENDRLFERQLRRHWRQIEDDEKTKKTFDFPQGDPDTKTPSTPSTSPRRQQYKLLPADAVPVLKMRMPVDAPPPLPPKSDPGRKRGFDTPKAVHSNSVVSRGQKDAAHYKILPTAELGNHDSTYESAPPPPLPPRCCQSTDSGARSASAEDRPSAIDGYKKLSSWAVANPAVQSAMISGLENESSKCQNGYSCPQRRNKILANYNRLPDPVPTVSQKCADGTSVRQSLETAV